ncbi:MAG: helix-turn-helix transcriptional regulator [bacterium]
MRERSLLTLYILDILTHHASEKKRITQIDLARYLSEEYRIDISRKTLGIYVNELVADGYVMKDHGLYRINTFDDHEIRVLIDGVLFGKHVSSEDAKILIDKLKDMSYLSIKNRVKHVCYLERINRTQNEHLYEIIDLIDEAIEQEKRIRIVGCKYGIDKKLHETHDTIVDPYYLITDQSRYYLVCYAGRGDDLENRRLDRISHVEILDEYRRPLQTFKKYQNGFDLSRYVNEHIYMFHGSSEVVILKIRQEAIGDFIDWYGMNYELLDIDDETLTISFSVNVNAFYYWALQYGSSAYVIRPESLRTRIREGLLTILENYQ